MVKGRVNHVAKGKRKPPSRMRYEQAHPIVSVRVPGELYDYLKEICQMSGKSFADLLKEGAAINEPSVKKSYDRGYDKGYDDGYEKGYDDGYDKGYLHASED